MIQTFFNPRFLQKQLPLFLASMIALAVILDPSRFSTFSDTLRDTSAYVFRFFHTPMDWAQKLLIWIEKQKGLNDELEQLRQQVHALPYYKRRIHEYEEENQRLRSLLQVVPEKPTTFITTRIVAIPEGRLSHSLILIASKDIKKNDAVLTEQGIIGKIIDIGNATARVLLPTHVNSRIPAKMERTNDPVLIVGNGTDSLDLIFPDRQQSSLQKGDIFMTSGQGGVYPAKYPIAEVKGFDNSGKPIVHSVIKPSDLDLVLVMRHPYNEEIK